MPVLPPVFAAPTDSLTTILNAARTRLREDIPTLYGVSGKILGEHQATTQQAVNNAWRKMQEKLVDLGFNTLSDEVIISGFPLVGSYDPATQCHINWTEYFDGLSLFPAPVLPSNLIQPLKIWERWHGQNAEFAPQPMGQVLDGLPAMSKQTANRWWEWRNNSIYFAGSLMAVDWRIKFLTYFADFIDVSTTPWFQQPVPIVRCLEPFSLYICAEFAPDAPTAQAYTAEAEVAAALLVNREIKAKQRVNVRRQPRSGRGSGRTSWY